MWITLSSADLQEKLGKAEFTAVTSAQLPDGVTGNDIIAEEITRTANMVRGYVAGHASNVLGAGITIPDELHDAALVILRHKVFSRLPQMKRLLDENRVREYDGAISLLKDTARGSFRVVPPETAAPQQVSGQSITVVRNNPRRNTREKWGGTL